MGFLTHHSAACGGSIRPESAGAAVSAVTLWTYPMTHDQMVHHGHWVEARLEVLAQRAMGQAAYLARRRFWRFLLRRTYSEVYDYLLAQDHNSTGVEGPICVYDAKYTLLLLKWGSSDPRRIVWQNVFKHRRYGVDAAFLLWPVCILLPHFYDRIRLQGSLSNFLRLLGISRPGRSVIQVSFEHERRFV